MNHVGACARQRRSGKTMRYVKFAILFLSVALAAPAGVIFSEDFEGATPGYDSTAGVIAGTQFTLVSGSIDINGPGNGTTIPEYYQELCVAPTSGNCIDTTGGGAPGRGTLSTTQAIVFDTPGEYLLSFDLAGWYETDVTDAYATVQVDLGTLIAGNQFTVYGADNPYAPVEIAFQVTAPTSANLTFTDLSGNHSFAGAILDNIEIDAVPEPASALFVGAGALILLAKKRARA